MAKKTMDKTRTGRHFLVEKKKTDTSINYQLLSFSEVSFYAFISYNSRGSCEYIYS